MPRNVQSDGGGHGYDCALRAGKWVGDGVNSGKFKNSIAAATVTCASNVFY